MESPDKVMAWRRQQIECRLLQIEVDVWADLNKEQQELVDAEQEKLDKLTQVVHEARILYHEEMAATLKKMDTVSATQVEERRARKEVQTEESSAQTDAQALVTVAQLDEVNGLREEVATLQIVASLQNEHSRLKNEPLAGETFVRLKESRRGEEVLIVELDKKISELEQQVHAAESEAELANLHPEAFTQDICWVPDDFTWGEAPWDCGDEEAVGASAHQPVEVFEGELQPWAMQKAPSHRFEGAQPGVFQGAPPPSRLNPAAASGAGSGRLSSWLRPRLPPRDGLHPSALTLSQSGNQSVSHAVNLPGSQPGKHHQSGNQAGNSSRYQPTQAYFTGNLSGNQAGNQPTHANYIGNQVGYQAGNHSRNQPTHANYTGNQAGTRFESQRGQAPSHYATQPEFPRSIPSGANLRGSLPTSHGRFIPKKAVLYKK